jgi:hypothetical protein
MRRRAGLMGLSLVILLGATASPAAAGDWRPFTGDVKATWDNIFLGLVAPPANFTGGGPVTFMGRTKQVGTLVLDQAIAPGIYPGSGSVTITAEDGDKLTFVYGGLLDANDGVGSGTFIFTGGTGKFAHATGGGIFYADIDLSVPTNQPMTVDLDGRIKF